MGSARLESSAVKYTLSLVSPCQTFAETLTDTNYYGKMAEKNPHSQWPMVGRGCPTDGFV